MLGSLIKPRVHLHTMMIKLMRAMQMLQIEKSNYS
jgi:hypothetical protein